MLSVLGSGNSVSRAEAHAPNRGAFDGLVIPQGYPADHFSGIYVRKILILLVSLIFVK